MNPWVLGCIVWCVFCVVDWMLYTLAYHLYGPQYRLWPGSGFYSLLWPRWRRRGKKPSGNYCHYCGGRGRHGEGHWVGGYHLPTGTFTTCPCCKGSGVSPGGDDPCGHCIGNGMVGTDKGMVDCKVCGGTGRRQDGCRRGELVAQTVTVTCEDCLRWLRLFGEPKEARTDKGATAS